MPGGLNKIDVRGYTRIMNFHPDHATIFWKSDLFGNICWIQFENNSFARRFRVVIEGFDYKGQQIHLEKIIE